MSDFGYSNGQKPGWRKRPRLLALSGLRRLLVFAVRFAAAAAIMAAGGPWQSAFGGEEIIIAAVGTKPTPLHPDGMDVISGVRDAIEALKARGNSRLTASIRLVTYEDDCSARRAEAIAGQIAVRGAALVVGHVCSAAALGAAAVYARRQILFITPGARLPRFTEPRAGSTIFRLAGRDDGFGADAANLILTRFHGLRVAIVHDMSVQARSLADAAERALVAAGTKAALREAYVNGEKEYNALVQRLAKQDIQVLVIPAQPVEAGIIFKGLIEAGSQATLIGSEILAVPEIAALAGAAPGRIITLLAAPLRPFASADLPHRKQFASTSSPIAQRSRAAVEAWAGAADRSGSLQPAVIGRALETELSDTVIGRFRFDIKGDALIPSFAPHVWRDGAWVPLGP